MGGGYLFQFDLVKFILSLFIVAIHTSLYPDYLYPWLRIAVPLFFMISSYMFFQRIHHLDKNEKISQLVKYVKRNLILYLFYFVLLFPIIIFITRRSYFDEGILKGIVLLIKSFFLGSTWGGSWFIMALIIGTPTAYFLSSISKKCCNLIPLCVGLMCFIVCCVCQSYSIFFTKTNIITNINNIFSPCTSFMVSIIWITIGKICAENEFKINNWILFILFGFALILLYLEWLFVKQETAVLTNDVYFSLVLVCPLIMILLIKMPNREIRNKKIFITMRNISTIMYAIHISIIPFINKLLQIIHLQFSILLFFCTILVCIIISICIICLEKNNKFKWLKYAH